MRTSDKNQWTPTKENYKIKFGTFFGDVLNIEIEDRLTKEYKFLFLYKRDIKKLIEILKENSLIKE